MSTNLIIKTRNKVKELKIIPCLIGFIERIIFYSKKIDKIVSVKDISGASDGYLAMIEDKKFFKDIPEGLPGIDYNSTNFIYLEYIKDGKKNKLCIFNIMPKKTIASAIVGYFFDEIKDDGSLLYVIYNSSLVFKSNYPSSDIIFHGNRYHALNFYNLLGKDLAELNGKADATKSPGQFLADSGYADIELKNSENKDIQKEKIIENYINNIPSPGISSGTGMHISRYIFDTITAAKLGEWVDDLIYLAKLETHCEIKIIKKNREMRIREASEALDERTRKRLNIKKDAEKDFDIGPYK